MKVPVFVPNGASPYIATHLCGWGNHRGEREASWEILSAELLGQAEE